jgi:hypothetical protein
MRLLYRKKTDLRSAGPGIKKEKPGGCGKAAGEGEYFTHKTEISIEKWGASLYTIV